MHIRTYIRPLMKSVVFWTAVFLIAASVSFSALGAGSEYRNYKNEMNFGGPVQGSSNSYVTGYSVSETPAVNSSVDNVFVSGSAVLGGENPSIGLAPLDNGTLQYKSRKGDTWNGIAEQFRITVGDLELANKGMKSVKPGSWIVIPVGESSSSIVSATPMNLPDIKNYFSLPAVGWNWGTLHNYNAVDIANECGTPVYAAQEGLIVSDPNLGDGSSGWNDGYGIFVFMEHPNGTKTRYAHLAKSLVKVGDYVAKGQEIGLMGNTGNTHGPTGCHLHFEVYGAKNPFAINQ